MHKEIPDADCERSDWDDFVENLKSLKEQVDSKILETERDGELSEWYDKRYVDFVNKAKADLGDLYAEEGIGRFVAFHILVGSTTNMEISPKLDMPPPYSVVDFWNSVLQELENPEKLLNNI